MMKISAQRSTGGRVPASTDHSSVSGHSRAGSRKCEESQYGFAGAFEMFPGLVCICRDGCIREINNAGARLLEAGNSEELYGRDILGFFGREYIECGPDLMDMLAREQAPVRIRMLTAAGNHLSVELTVGPVPGLGPDYMMLMAQDITQRVALCEAIHRSEERLWRILDNALNLVCTCDQGKITYINESGLAMIGACHDREVVGKPLSALFHHDYRDLVENSLDILAAEEGAFRAKSRRFDGDIIDVEALLTPLTDGTSRQLMVEIRDITKYIETVKALRWSNQNLEDRVIERTRTLRDEIREREKAEQKIRQLATTDHLTGLPNRLLLIDRLQTALREAHRYDRKVGLMFVDLDGFKAVNDTYGHETGDKLLKWVAGRMIENTRQADTVARIGGDEFVILLPSIPSREITRIVAGKILSAISKPMLLEEQVEVTIGASIGGALFPDDGNDLDELLNQADGAMYQVKKTGKNAFRFAREG